TAEPGQVVHFPKRSFKRLDVEVLDVRDTPAAAASGRSAFGFAEIGVPGVTVDEVVALPSAPLQGLGATAEDHALAYVLTRDRTAAHDRIRRDNERAIVRSFTVPTDRAFTLTGTVRLESNAPDDVIDAVVRSPSATAPVVSSSSRLRGDAASRASAAL